MPKPKQKGFLDYVHDHRLPFIPDEYGFSRRVVYVARNKVEFRLDYMYNDEAKVVDSFDFTPFFPIDNGEEPPYFRKREVVDRYEAGMYFFYRRWCKKNGLKDEGFVPFPPPSKKQIIASMNDDWPFN